MGDRFLEQDVGTRDNYNRRRPYVGTGESMLDWQLVRQGWAVDGFTCRPADKRRKAC